MKRRVATCMFVAMGIAPLAADVRVTSQTTVEGAFAPMMSGAAPRTVLHIKGNKARADVTVGTQSLSTITDVEAKEVILLNATEKTAQVISPTSRTGALPFPLPKIDAAVKPTGRSQTVAGAACDEFTISMDMSMAEMAGSGQMPPAAAEMMKSVRLKLTGNMWIAQSGPGVAEYSAFHKASAKAAMAAMMAGIPGVKGSGIERLMNAITEAGGIPYLSELRLTLAGNDKIPEQMTQEGVVKITTKVVEVSTESLSDDLFKVPEDYKVTR